MLVSAKVIERSDVPVIDLSRLIAANEVDDALAQDILRACRDVGFMYVSGHGIPIDLQDRMFDASREFFARSMEQKLDISITRSRHFRGYLPLKSIGASSGRPVGRQEGFQIHAELPPDDPDVLAGKPLHAPNPWPSFMPELRPVTLEYYSAVQSLGMSMLRAFARALQMEEDFFGPYFQKPLMMLRLLHYPPQDVVTDENDIGVLAHTDAGGFTILLQDMNGGLEIRTKDGEWARVPPIENTFVINLGEMMQAWTNGVFMATPHRVVNWTGRDRYSIPFFMNPNFDAVIRPIRIEGDEARFPTLQSGPHLLETYRRIWPEYQGTEGDGR